MARSPTVAPYLFMACSLTMVHLRLGGSFFEVGALSTDDSFAFQWCSRATWLAHILWTKLAWMARWLLLVLNPIGWLATPAWCFSFEMAYWTTLVLSHVMVSYLTLVPSLTRARLCHLGTRVLGLASTRLVHGTRSGLHPFRDWGCVTRLSLMVLSLRKAAPGFTREGCWDYSSAEGRWGEMSLAHAPARVALARPRVSSAHACARRVAGSSPVPRSSPRC